MTGTTPTSQSQCVWNWACRFPTSPKMTPPQASPVWSLAPSPKPEAWESGFTSPSSLFPRGDFTFCIGLQAITSSSPCSAAGPTWPCLIWSTAVPPPLMWPLEICSLQWYQNNPSVHRIDPSLDRVFRSAPIPHEKSSRFSIHHSRPASLCLAFAAPSVTVAPLPVCAPVWELTEHVLQTIASALALSCLLCSKHPPFFFSNLFFFLYSHPLWPIHYSLPPGTSCSSRGL